jgi:hypothetical protein
MPECIANRSPTLDSYDFSVWSRSTSEIEYIVLDYK